MQPGYTIARHTILSLLGRGGMGEVWLDRSDTCRSVDSASAVADNLPATPAPGGGVEITVAAENQSAEHIEFGSGFSSSRSFMRNPSQAMDPFAGTTPN
ncbi:MAG: hypothetical protein RBT60_14840 [Candidatus Krumholzibacteria bacterium]|nr:hypothetical protein [Candidatus Krumholzibacteria bacterium]